MVQGFQLHCPSQFLNSLIHSFEHVVEVNFTALISLPHLNSQFSHFTASVKFSIQSFHCLSQILNSVIPLPQPNSQFSHFTVPAKFTIHSFHCPSQILNSLISLFQPNSQFSHFTVLAKFTIQFLLIVQQPQQLQTCSIHCWKALINGFPAVYKASQCNRQFQCDLDFPGKSWLERLSQVNSMNLAVATKYSIQ